MPPSRFCPLVNGDCHAKCILLDPKSSNCLLFLAAIALLSQSVQLDKIKSDLSDIKVDTSSISDRG